MKICTFPFALKHSFLFEEKKKKKIILHKWGKKACLDILFLLRSFGLCLCSSKEKGSVTTEKGQDRKAPVCILSCRFTIKHWITGFLHGASTILLSSRMPFTKEPALKCMLWTRSFPKIKQLLSVAFNYLTKLWSDHS